MGPEPDQPEQTPNPPTYQPDITPPPAPATPPVTPPAEEPPTTDDTISPETTPAAPDTPAEDVTPASEAPIATPEPPGAEQPESSTPSMPTDPLVSPESAAPVMGGVAPVSKRRKLPKVLLPVVAALLILGAGTAAAYVTVIAPNQPEAVLRTAIENTLQQRQVSSNISFDASPTSGSGVAYKVAATTSSNLDSKALDMVLNVTVSGVTIPVEARLVDQNAYVKVGDLRNITSLVNSFAPGAGATVTSLANEVSNKWVVFDSTLLKEAGASCVLNTNWTVSKSDIAGLESAYQKNSFVTIKSTASDSVNGKAAEKFTLSINDNKGAAYFKNLSGLPMVQALQKCSSSSSKTIDTSSLADGDTTPITVWVDKASKRIVKFDMESTQQDAQKAHLQGSLVATLSYGNVQISAPQGAVPALQLLGQIEASNPSLMDALGNASAAGSTGTSSNDAKRQTDIMSLQTQLEAFFAQNGYYPSLTDMNSASWRAAHLKSLDPSALQDPQGTGQLLAAKPAAKIYAYQVTTASGASCESHDTTCAKYTLTATLSTGSPYAKQSLN